MKSTALFTSLSSPRQKHQASSEATQMCRLATDIRRQRSAAAHWPNAKTLLLRRKRKPRCGRRNVPCRIFFSNFPIPQLTSALRCHIHPRACFAVAWKLKSPLGCRSSPGSSNNYPPQERRHASDITQRCIGAVHDDADPAERLLTCRSSQWANLQRLIAMTTLPSRPTVSLSEGRSGVEPLRTQSRVAQRWSCRAKGAEAQEFQGPKHASAVILSGSCRPATPSSTRRRADLNCLFSGSIARG